MNHDHGPIVSDKTLEECQSNVVIREHVNALEQRLQMVSCRKGLVEDKLEFARKRMMVLDAEEDQMSKRPCTKVKQEPQGEDQEGLLVLRNSAQGGATPLGGARAGRTLFLRVFVPDECEECIGSCSVPQGLQ